jgi:hypothetical protein
MIPESQLIQIAVLGKIQELVTGKLHIVEDAAQ